MRGRNIENALFKLDLLECKFHNLDPPRFNKTQEICHSRKNNYKLLEVPDEEAEELIKRYQHEQFELKYDEFYGKLEKVLNKLLKQEKKSSDKFKRAVEVVEKDDALRKLNLRFKLDKTISKIFKRKIKEKSQIIPKTFYVEYKDIHLRNPHESNTKEIDTLFSKLFGKVIFRDCIEKMKVQFKLILGPVRQEYSNKDSAESIEESHANEIEQKGTGEDAKVNTVETTMNNELDLENHKGEHATNGNSEDGNKKTGEMALKEGQEGVETEDEEVQNEANTGSASELDDFFKEDTESERTTGKGDRKKIVLPAIMSGYYSGDEDEDELEKADRDNEVQKVTSKHRKNRRGQRARRKIWEKKFGKNAKHLVKEREEWHAKQQRLEHEYEIRVEKRAEKQKKHEEWMEKQKEKKKEIEALKNKPLHPSWTAKRKLEESLAHVKFEGKKQKFA